MRCVVHIGTEKTGTTMLQKWLYLNKRQLSKQRVYLSELLGKTNNRLLPTFFQPYLDDWAKQHKISSFEEKDIFFKDFEDKFSAEIEQASVAHDVFIITSEHFSSRIRRREDIEKIQTFLSKRFDEITIICYFRNQADMAVSLYSTALKGAATISVDRFLSTNITPNNYYYNLKAIADNWASVFGNEHCNFRIYDRIKFINEDLRLDFISTFRVPIDTAKLDFSKTSSNASLSLLEAAVFRRINEFVPYWDELNGGMNLLNIRLKDAVASLDCLDHGVISNPNSHDILNRFDETNAQFFKEYFGCETNFKISKDTSSEDKKFSLAEVEQIIYDLSEVFLPYVSSEYHPSLYDADADYLRDIAVAIEKGKKMHLTDALRLMSLAKRARPNGPLIVKRVKELEAKLKVNDVDERSWRSTIRRLCQVGKSSLLIRFLLKHSRGSAKK